MASSQGSSSKSNLSSIRASLSSLPKLEFYTPFDDSKEAYTERAIPTNKRLTPYARPAAIVYPKSPQEVSSVVKLASQAGLSVVSRCGGHHYAAYSSGVTDQSVTSSSETSTNEQLNTVNPIVVVDVSNFTSIEFEKETGIVSVSAGCRLERVIAELAKLGRALPHGTCPNVGIGGHAAHGGWGFTSRCWGLTVDRIVEHQVVLANGDVVKTSKNDRPDLFWALRGAAPSYGIVLNYKLVTEPMPAINAVAQYVWDVDPQTAANVFLEYQSWIPNSPAELGIAYFLWQGKDTRNLGIAFQIQYIGPMQGLKEALHATFLENPAYPTASSLGPPNPESFVEKECSFTEALDWLGTGTGNSDTFYVKSLTVPEQQGASLLENGLTKEQMKSLTEYLAKEGNAVGERLGWFVMVDNWGGQHSKINKAPLADTAYGSRSNLIGFQFYARSIDRLPPFPSNGISFVDGILESILSTKKEGWKYGGNSNYPDPALSREEAQRLYYGEKVPKLREIKRKYDPSNLFQFPHSILP